MNYFESTDHDCGPQVLIQPKAFCNEFDGHDFDYVEIREHIPGSSSTVNAGSFVWKDGEMLMIDDTELSDKFEIYGYTVFDNEEDLLIEGHPVRHGVIVHTQRHGLRDWLRTCGRFDGVILDHPVSFRNLFRDQNFDRVEIHCFALGDAFFCGAFKWDSNRIISLDGDCYSDDMLVFGYNEFVNESHNVKKGLNIFNYTM